jgi:uncharacterized protein YjbI with pentapeptide repeats
VSGATVSGATVSGATVSGATVSGATVSGATVSGATVSGATVFFEVRGSNQFQLSQIASVVVVSMTSPTPGYPG